MGASLRGSREIYIHNAPPSSSCSAQADTHNIIPACVPHAIAAAEQAAQQLAQRQSGSCAEWHELLSAGQIARCVRNEVPGNGSGKQDTWSY